MAKNLYWLSDAEWASIQPHLPIGRRDCPAQYGPYTTIYNRFNRWSKQGVWEGIFYALSGCYGVTGTTSADSTSVKAHDLTGVTELLTRIPTPRRLLADRAYSRMTQL